ncbi:MAG: hypothetical protein JWR55_771 [Aeromicrobium sp.]|jgi:hypothetical protein|nr:hypothetical protein [Aeromicrobium sp.]
MKKIVLALFAAVALVLGSGALVSGASAAVYPNTIATKTSISAPNSVNEGKSLNVIVRVRAGNAVVREGKVTVIFGGRSYTKSVSGTSVKFKVKAPSVKKTTTKTLKASYKPANNSVFKASNDTDTVKVKNKKKK